MTTPEPGTVDYNAKPGTMDPSQGHWEYGIGSGKLLSGGAAGDLGAPTTDFETARKVTGWVTQFQGADGKTYYRSTQAPVYDSKSAFVYGQPANTGGLGQAGANSADSAYAALQNKSAYDMLIQLFNSYGLGSLAGKIKEYAVRGDSTDTISMELQTTPEYQQRFAGNIARQQNGLPVLSPAEYLATEASYRQVLDSSGLDSGQWEQQGQYASWIGGDVSPSEIKSRVDVAAQWVNSRDPQYRSALQQFYGIDQSHLLAYALDRKVGLPLLQQRAAAAGIGAEALRQGFTGVSANQAENYASQGISQAQAANGFQQAAVQAPLMQGLSSAYGRQAGVTYGNSDAVDQYVGGLASAQRKQQQLAQQAIADFNGATGSAGQGSLARKSQGQF